MKKISAYIILGLAGLGLFVFLYNKTYPTAAVELNIPKEKAVQISKDFLETLGYDIDKFSQAVVFSSNETQLLYLQSVLGIEETNKLIRKDNFLWFWSVRWFKELEKEEFWVGVNPETGKVEHFDRDILDEDAGSSLASEQAMSIAEQFLKLQGYNPDDLVFMDTSQDKQKNRIDYSFEWEKKDYRIGEATLRIAVRILGDKVGSFYRYLKTPEIFSREYQKKLSYGQVLSLISVLLTIFIFLAAFISLIILIRQNHYIWRFAFYSAWIVAILGLFEFFNALPLLWYGYNTTISKTVFFNINFLSSLIGTVIFGLVIFLFGAVGHSLSRQVFTEDKLPVLAAIKEKRFTFSDSRGIVVGYCMSFFFLGAVALFYYFGTKYWGVWIPMGSKYSNMLGTYFPFINPVTVGMIAAVSEEFIFRLFTISLIKKYLKKDFLAVVLPALIWAFAHSSYTVFPSYIRGIELTFVGIVLGYLFLKFGIECVIIAHYSVNAVLVSIPLLESGNIYYRISGIAVILLAFIPILLIFIFKIFKKFRERNNK